MPSQTKLIYRNQNNNIRQVSVCAADCESRESGPVTATDFCPGRAETSHKYPHPNPKVQEVNCTHRTLSFLFHVHVHPHGCMRPPLRRRRTQVPAGAHLHALWRPVRQRPPYSRERELPHPRCLGANAVERMPRMCCDTGRRETAHMLTCQMRIRTPTAAVAEVLPPHLS